MKKVFLALFVILLSACTLGAATTPKQKVSEFLDKYKNENTICGYVENIGREGERAVVTTLKDLRNTSVNMFTTVFVGNSQTKNINGKMVTPRGYKNG